MLLGLVQLRGVRWRTPYGRALASSAFRPASSCRSSPSASSLALPCSASLPDRRPSSARGLPRNGPRFLGPAPSGGLAQAVGRSFRAVRYFEAPTRPGSDLSNTSVCLSWIERQRKQRRQIKGIGCGGSRTNARGIVGSSCCSAACPPWTFAGAASCLFPT